MSIQEDFQLVLQAMEKLRGDAKPSLDEVLLRMLAFFHNVKVGLKEASPEQKKEIMESVQHMHDELGKLADDLKGKLGKGDEELLAHIDNPEYFTENQRELLHSSQKQVSETIKSLNQSKKPHKPKHSGSSKKKWMKS